MTDLTYTATGRIDVTTRSLILELFLPIEDPTNPYEFNYNVDLSKITLDKGQINAVFCHLKLKNDSGARLSYKYPSDKHKITIKIDELIKYNSKYYRNFNVDLDETLFILFHDNESLDLKITDLFHENIEKLYEETQKTKSENTEESHNLNFFSKPRAIGMSIIAKK